MDTFAALADETRLRIVDALAEREMTAGEIAGMFSVSRPAISRHLRVLREAGLAQARGDAQRRIYRIDPRPLYEIDRWLERYRRFWSARLDGLERHLDATVEKVEKMEKMEKTTNAKQAKKQAKQQTKRKDR